MIRVSVNAKKLVNRLQQINKRSDTEVAKALEASALIIEAKAKARIQRGPKTGRLYARGAISHQASAPGESPATDTGRLVSSISHWVMDGGKRVLVGTRMAEGRWMEFGTRRVLPRPWLIPSVEETRAQVRRVLAAAWQKAVGK